MCTASGRSSKQIYLRASGLGEFGQFDHNLPGIYSGRLGKGLWWGMTYLNGLVVKTLILRTAKLWLSNICYPIFSDITLYNDRGGGDHPLIAGPLHRLGNTMWNCHYARKSWLGKERLSAFADELRQVSERQVHPDCSHLRPPAPAVASQARIPYNMCVSSDTSLKWCSIGSGSCVFPGHFSISLRLHINRNPACSHFQNSWCRCGFQNYAFPRYLQVYHIFCRQWN